MGLIVSDETADRYEVQRLLMWCTQNDLVPNTCETKERVIYHWEKIWTTFSVCILMVTCRGAPLLKKAPRLLKRTAGDLLLLLHSKCLLAALQLRLKCSRGSLPPLEKKSSATFCPPSWTHLQPWISPDWTVVLWGGFQGNKNGDKQTTSFYARAITALNIDT